MARNHFRASLAAAAAITLAVAAGPAAAAGSQPPDPATRIAAQRTAMGALAQLDGEWRGTVTIRLPSGDTRTMTQTERVGSLLDGSIKVIEGRAYDPDGSTAFNAVAIVSYDPRTQTYNFRSYAHGQSGDFKLTPTSDGFVWEAAAGPATMRYTAVVKDGRWTETGERIVPGEDPLTVVTLALQRIGDSEWPAGGAVPRQ
jgi:hypothetical protein